MTSPEHNHTTDPEPIDDLIASFREKLDERGRLAREVLKDPGHPLAQQLLPDPRYLYKTRAVGGFLAGAPFEMLRALAATYALLDLLDAARRRRDAIWEGVAARASGSTQEQPPLPDGPNSELIPGLEAAVRVLAAQYDDPEPAIRKWLETAADQWKTTGTIPPSRLSELVDEVWISLLDQEMSMSPPEDPIRHVVRATVEFSAELFNGETVSITRNVR
ncbi:hypothetical protein GCM10022252_75040 [Streptosporangium oxazolinicum]|uniref:TetR family transcriptional regulator n=1 Tax=Streptosporangium oxazolinicum TaxID=909287 RepID=A0ABP8BKS0_9ACTN